MDYTFLRIFYGYGFKILKNMDFRLDMDLILLVKKVGLSAVGYRSIIHGIVKVNYPIQVNSGNNPMQSPVLVYLETPREGRDKVALLKSKIHN